MRATDLIAELQKAVDAFGDLEVISHGSVPGLTRPTGLTFAPEVRITTGSPQPDLLYLDSRKMPGEGSALAVYLLDQDSAVRLDHVLDQIDAMGRQS